MRSNISNRAVGFSIPLLVIFSTASMGALQENDVTPDVPESQIVVQANDESLPLVDDDHRDIERNIRLNQEDISKIRRDQIDYKLEKNILKEAYSSSIQTINTVITIVFAILAILGFLGIRNVRDLQKRFSVEFSALKELRLKYEKQLQDIESGQESAKAQLLEIAEINQTQDVRLQVLEIQEKVAAMIVQQDYERAQAYNDIGIDLSPDDLILLAQRAQCFWSLNDIPQAIVTLRRIHELDPKDINTVANLAEMYLLTLDHQSFDALLEDNPILAELKKPWLMLYLQALREFAHGEPDALREVIRSIIERDDPVTKPDDDTWVFAEVRVVLGAQPDTPQKKLLLMLIEYFSGKLPVDNFIAALAEGN